VAHCGACAGGRMKKAFMEGVVMFALFWLIIMMFFFM
jgi:hypothetical protein